jgi:hypothetical protein
VRSDPELVPDVEHDPTATPTAPSDPARSPSNAPEPSAPPLSRAERRALSRAKRATSSWAAGQRSVDKADAFDAAAELRRVKAGTGRYTPPSSTRGAKRQRKGGRSR